jgi:hypothetical protein
VDRREVHERRAEFVCDGAILAQPARHTAHHRRQGTAPMNNGPQGSVIHCGQH